MGFLKSQTGENQTWLSPNYAAFFPKSCSEIEDMVDMQTMKVR